MDEYKSLERMYWQRWRRERRDMALSRKRARDGSMVPILTTSMQPTWKGRKTTPNPHLVVEPEPTDKENDWKLVEDAQPAVEDRHDVQKEVCSAKKEGGLTVDLLEDATTPPGGNNRVEAKLAPGPEIMRMMEDVLTEPGRESKPIKRQ